MTARTWTLAVAASLAACAVPAEDANPKTKDTEQALTATTTTSSISSSVDSTSQDLGGFNIVGVEPATATVFNLNVTAQARWLGTIGTNVTWDTDKVRQGQHLDVTRVATTTDGVIKVLWSVTGTLRPLDLFDVNIGTIPLSVDVSSCAPSLDPNAGSFDCSASSSGIDLVYTPGVPASPWVDLALGVHFTITPNGGVVTRQFLVGDTEVVPQDDLDLTTQNADESVAMPCSQPVGTDVQYVLDPYHWSPASTSASQQPQFDIGVTDPFIGVGKITIASVAFGQPALSSPAFDLTGAGTSVDLGALQENNVLPTIAPLGPFNGNEGSPVHFSASTTSACPITSYQWAFSDGTNSFGPTPQRTFGQDGVLNGELTVTDSTHLSAAGDFSVNIANVPPTVDAGPDTSGAWGTQIAFHGQAVDPGFDDQATLTYQWNFGDGTPGSGGAIVSHAYAVPGDYVATLTVCDDHVCVPATTHVHVRARTTSVAVTGANTGVFSWTATLGGSIVDELGQPVVGGTLSFQLNGAAAGSAQTNANGNAASVQAITLPAGAYPISATYAGSAFYVGGSASSTFTVTAMPTVIQYTGSTSGGPNKTVALSAKLTDVFNRAVAGKTVVFVLGSQQASATTNAQGVASTKLVLNQHNGSYSLTSSWTPAGVDATEWTGTSTSTTFVVGH